MHDLASLRLAVRHQQAVEPRQPVLRPGQRDDRVAVERGGDRGQLPIAVMGGQEHHRPPGGYGRLQMVHAFHGDEPVHIGAVDHRQAQQLDDRSAHLPVTPADDAPRLGRRDLAIERSAHVEHADAGALRLKHVPQLAQALPHPNHERGRQAAQETADQLNERTREPIEHRAPLLR